MLPRTSERQPKSGEKCNQTLWPPRACNQFIIIEATATTPTWDLITPPQDSILSWAGPGCSQSSIQNKEAPPGQGTPRYLSSHLFFENEPLRGLIPLEGAEFYFEGSGRGELGGSYFWVKTNPTSRLHISDAHGIRYVGSFVAGRTTDAAAQ